MRTPGFPLSVIAVSILLGFNTIAIAQESKNASSESDSSKLPKKAPVKALDTPMQKVEVQGAKNYDERRQDTATKIVVTQEDIVRYGDTTVGDVLKRLPGITMGGVQGRGGEIRMRGLGSGYTQIMLNGEPSPPGFSLDSISPDLIERIEIIRAATAELSTQAIAGAINIVLKRAVQTAQREVKVGASEDGGKFSENVNLQISDKAGRYSYSVSGNFNHGQYERPSTIVESGADVSGKPNKQTRTDQLGWGTFNGIGLSPRVNISLANGDTLTSQSFVNANRFAGYTSETSLPLLEKLPTYFSDLQRIESDFAMVRSDLNWIHKLADSAKLEVKFGLNFNRRNSDVGLLGYGKEKNQILDRKSTSDASDKGFTSTGKYSAPFVEDHAFVFGWDGAYSKRNEHRLQTDIVAPGSNLIALPLNETYDADVTRVALFAQDEWNVTKQWSVYAGLRWEAIETRNQGTGYDEVTNKSSVLSPILQTLWKIPGSKNDQVRLGLTRTYKAPSSGQLIPRRYQSNNNSETSPDSIGNPNLKPELAWGIDAAFEHYLADGGTLSASVYMRKIDDIIRTKLDQINGIWFTSPANDGQATTKGIELDGKFPLRSIISDAPAIDFRANLSLNWSDLKTVPGPNNRLDSQTPVSANIGMDYKLSKVPLTIGGNASYQSGGLVRISAEQTTYSVPKRVLDLYALWKFDPKTNLRISVANLLHQDNVSSNTVVNQLNGTSQQIRYTPTTVAVRAMLEHKF
jgi:outer membrane receptor protein involved in Fe transport